ncbi:MAG: deoxyribonuclease IV [Thermodesulfobacteriota bacterium]
MPLLGAHMSVAGGLHRAFDHLRKINGEALQIFTRNQRQWRAAPVSAAEASSFRAAWQQAGRPPVASHDSYLINLASPKAEVAAKSVQALIDELERCATLGIPYVVMHPGAHLGSGIEQGIALVAKNLDAAFAAASPAEEVMVLLENTAGQGTTLGAGFAELAGIIAASRHPARLGVCFDTCHAFAAGHDLRTPKAYAQTMAEFEAVIGLARLRFFHLNDAIKGLGSRIDRHTHIGQGQIGLDGFRLLLNDRRFKDHPMVLETPKDEQLTEDIENLRTLRGLLRG